MRRSSIVGGVLDLGGMAVALIGMSIGLDETAGAIVLAVGAAMMVAGFFLFFWGERA